MTASRLKDLTDFFKVSLDSSRFRMDKVMQSIDYITFEFARKAKQRKYLHEQAKLDFICPNVGTDGMDDRFSSNLDKT